VEEGEVVVGEGAEGEVVVGEGAEGDAAWGVGEAAPPKNEANCFGTITDDVPRAY
jgi:hypothetical protein